MAVPGLLAQAPRGGGRWPLPARSPGGGGAPPVDDSAEADVNAPAVCAPSSPEVVGGRYEIARLVGSGGAAMVHRARDVVSGRTVALKRLRPETGMDRARLEELFRQEFHTLAHLSHPNIVAVYDYGVDEGASYYTMELLDGGDLLERVPLDWRSACSVARDLCSALSLVHSRRLVYRDLSPRNVRCTASGTAKLLDFGALAPVGRTQMFVGTPAFAAPEAANLQPVDARTDLYSLGATLYFALTGRRPYAAATLPQLQSAFQSIPPPPGHLALEMPRELDALITDMMQLEPSLRPASAAEVMDRLGAIAGLDRTEHLLVSKAYLSTPTLVGRDTSLERFRRRLAVARSGTGSAMLVEGPRGSGRSRFLDACVLEAKLAGATVIRADGSDGASGDYGAARALASQLLDALPDVARAAAAPARALLSTVVPALRGEGDAGGPVAEGAPPVNHAILQPALREWFAQLAKEHPLVIAVDDFHEMDVPSASLVALLAREAPASPILVLASRSTEERSSPTKALEVLESSSRAVKLGPLSASRTERLMRALFGDVPNVGMAASRIHAVSGGLPRDVMHLAQHLVDAGLARYDAGAWVLPQRFGEGDLPTDMTAARTAKVAALTAGACTVAQAFALAPDGVYSFDECVLLGGMDDAASAMKSLDELLQADIVLPSSKDYALARGFREALRQSVSDGSAAALHASIARVLQRRGGEEIRVARHLFAAGEETRGLDVLVGFSDRSLEETGRNMQAFTRLLQTLPDGWLDVYDRAIDLSTTHGRPRRELLTLHIRVTGILSQLPIDGGRYFAPLFAQLRHDSGLDLWEASVDAPTERARLEAALGGAAARYAQGDAGGSVFDPKTAIGHLGRAVAAAAGSVSSCLAVDLWKILPPLAPFVPLAPALSAWQALIDGVGARITARTDLARELYERQLGRLAAPDRAGLDETYQRTQELGIALVLGTADAAMGLESTLERARVLEASPLHEINAKRIRMLYHLWQGDLAEAERLRSQAEILTVERVGRQTNEGAHLPRELQAHALAEDLPRVKRSLAAIEPLSTSALGWRPVLHRARAAYEQIRGDLEEALVEIEASLAAMDPEGHPSWPDAAAAHVAILLGAGRVDDARTIGEAYLAQATARGIAYEACHVRMPLAVAHARGGAAEDALRQCEAVEETFRALGTRGMNLGLACEARARVALELGDREGFTRFAAQTADHFRAGTNPALAAKLQRLMREGRRREGSGGTARAAVPGGEGEIESVVRVLDSCTTPEQRLSGALTLLLDRAGAARGFLLSPDDGHLVVRARAGAEEVAQDLLACAQRFWETQCRMDDETDMTDGSKVDGDAYRSGDRDYRPILLSHDVASGLALTGVAMVATDPGTSFQYPVRLAMAVSRLVMGDQAAVLVGVGGQLGA